MTLPESCTWGWLKTDKGVVHIQNQYGLTCDMLDYLGM